MPLAGTYNIITDQGTTFSRVLTYKDNAGIPINLTNYTAKMQVRPATDSSTVLVELSTANGRITLGGALGTITLNAPASVMDFEGGVYVYDLELTTGASVTRVVMGSFTNRAEVTK